MPIHEIRVTQIDSDPLGQGVLQEAHRTLGLSALEAVETATVYRVEGVSVEEADILARQLFTDPVNEQCQLNQKVPYGTPHVVEVGYKPGVMNPAVASIIKAAADLGITVEAADVSREYAFFGDIEPEQVNQVVGRLLMNKTVERVITETPATLTFEGSVGPIAIVPVREASIEELRELSKDKLFLDDAEMDVIQKYFRGLGRDPTDAELEIIAARWSEHCGHKTFNAVVEVDGVRKEPLFTRIKKGAKRHFKDLVISAFDDNSGVIRFYDGQAICGKGETHNTPSAVEPYGGAATGTSGVDRDVKGTGQGAKTIVSTDMFCFAPPDLDESLLPPGTLHPDYLLRRVVAGVGDYGNRMGFPTGNGSIHYHEDFRAKPTVLVGAYGILPEKYAQKGEPQVGDLVVIVGGRTGRDGIHGATFSSGEMTDRTASVNSSAVQIGNAIEQKRMSDALLEARDQDCIRAITDCGAAGFSSAIGEIGEKVGVTVDISKAPVKYPGLAPWEIWVSESQERMVVAISPDKIDAFMAVCQKYNVESTVIGEFDGSHTLTVNYGEQNVAQLDYGFLTNGLPQRVMQAHWEQQEVPEVRPVAPENPQAWISAVKAVLAHGNVNSKESVVRKYDHGVQGGNVVSPFGGVTQEGPNDALVVRPILGKPYGMVVAHGMNPILNRIDPRDGTIWAITEAAANYVAVGGDITQAAGVGNYVWQFPDKEGMGLLDRSVDAAVEMMDVLGLPVISGKDSLSSTYRGNGEVIKIPPVYAMSIFGRIPDVEKTMTSDIKKPGSTLVLVGKLSDGMAGSTYYDVANGSSNALPVVDTGVLPAVLGSVHQAITSGKVLACHDVSEGGVIAAVSEMCFGGGLGATLEPPTAPGGMDRFLFSETVGCFVVEVANAGAAQELFGNVPYITLGKTTTNKTLEVREGDISGSNVVFSVSTDELKDAWQAPMRGIFH